MPPHAQFQPVRNAERSERFKNMFDFFGKFPDAQGAESSSDVRVISFQQLSRVCWQKSIGAQPGGITCSDGDEDVPHLNINKKSKPLLQEASQLRDHRPL